MSSWKKKHNPLPSSPKPAPLLVIQTGLRALKGQLVASDPTPQAQGQDKMQWHFLLDKNTAPVERCWVAAPPASFLEAAPRCVEADQNMGFFEGQVWHN
jgi:hypothetical protein